jgi:hypothetical protein
MHWTPFDVTRRAASIFAAHRHRRVLDVGAEPGKLCIAAASAQPRLSFTGLLEKVLYAFSGKLLQATTFRL